MEKTEQRKIRKIIVGNDPKNSFAFELGKEYNTPAGLVKIHEIEEDQSNYYFFGNIRFNVWIEKSNKEITIWKSVERLPILIEYEI